MVNYWCLVKRHYVLEMTWVSTECCQGVELGPLEIKIHSLQKSIDTEVQEISELQQRWLRDQSELVRLAKEKDAQSSNLENMKKQLTILTQKKMRMEGMVCSEKNTSGVN